MYKTVYAGGAAPWTSRIYPGALPPDPRWGAWPPLRLPCTLGSSHQGIGIKKSRLGEQTKYTFLISPNFLFFIPTFASQNPCFFRSLYICFPALYLFPNLSPTGPAVGKQRIKLPLCLRISSPRVRGQCPGTLMDPGPRHPKRRVPRAGPDPGESLLVCCART